jgi:3-hydroxyacyl-[acyl-carrier-protein] dehydratase
VTAGEPVALGLPHREPFVFVDQVIGLSPGESAECVKMFPPETPFFAGHFPGVPLVPGVILVEALAQTAGLAAGQTGRALRLAAIKTMKFPSAAGPGEEIRLCAKKAMTVGGLWQFEVRASVQERVVAEGIVVLSEGGEPPGPSPAMASVR